MHANAVYRPSLHAKSNANIIRNARCEVLGLPCYVKVGTFFPMWDKWDYEHTARSGVPVFYQRSCRVRLL